MLSIALGIEHGQVAQILSSLGSLNFSRDNEPEADLESVDYLAKPPYRCDVTATFFKQLSAAGQSGGPVFLSTNPSSDDRVEKITAEAMAIGCDTKYYATSSYIGSVNSLP